MMGVTKSPPCIHNLSSFVMDLLCFILQDDITCGNELRQAAFRAYASLGANDEDIRKRVSTSGVYSTSGLVSISSSYSIFYLPCIC